MTNIQPILPPAKRYHMVLALFLCFFSAVMAAYISRTVFERLPHLEDEMAYVWQARAIAGGNFVLESPQPRLAFWQPFVVDLEGTRFGKYTPGWPLQLAVGELLGQPWIINALATALTVALVYRFGREVFNPDAGVIAAGLVAFSPMALLLNGTLMGHTTALLWTTLFLYAYWRLEQGRHRLRWGIIAGVALGLLVASRPATALAVAIPFVAWSGVRLLRQLARILHFRLAAQERITFGRMLTPLLALGGVAVIIALVVPLYNYQAAGSPTRNLYRLVWDYDRLGFGQGYGRNGHTLEKGVRHMRFDLSLTAADLFGWQTEPLRAPLDITRPDLYDHFINQGDYYPALGVSWLLLPFGLIVAFRRCAPLIIVWLGVGLAWLAFPFLVGEGVLTRDPAYAWVCVLGLITWLCLPLLVMRERKTVWPWLILSVALALIIVQLTYWIGSQRYSTRYFYEGLTSVALISALPIAWLARRGVRPWIYALTGVVLVYSLLFYSLPRISVLRSYNFITRELVDEVNARREGRPALVIVTGEQVRWRSLAPLMAITSPYLNSDVVAARVSSTISRAEVIAQFPNRQIIEMRAQENQSWFADEEPPVGIQ